VAKKVIRYALLFLYLEVNDETVHRNDSNLCNYGNPVVFCEGYLWGLLNLFWKMSLKYGVEFYE